MKSLGDAIVVRNHVLDALNVADNQADDADRKKHSQLSLPVAVLPVQKRPAL